MNALQLSIKIIIIGVLSILFGIQAVWSAKPAQEKDLLDVSILVFDPGIPEDAKTMNKQSIFPEVRKAEARYIAYTLRLTLENSGHWGAVRVIPQETSAFDVLVKGEIISSNGTELAVNVLVQDASGHNWVRKRYRKKADEKLYAKNHRHKDEFQIMYDRIANDMRHARNRLTEKKIAKIQAISELRFATDLAPQTFDGYLKQGIAGRYSIKRLPARNDPMMVRINKIRNREYMLIDTLDEQYAEFVHNMEAPYDEWRRSSYGEFITMKETRRAARRKMAGGALAVFASIFVGAKSSSVFSSAAATVGVLGGTAVFKRGLDQHDEVIIHVETLRELARTFNTNITPRVVEVEGKTVTLTGSAEKQYKEWRRLLREMYILETGLLNSKQTQPPKRGKQKEVSL